MLALLASGYAHGYALVGELAQLGITDGPVDVGQVYRTKEFDALYLQAVALPRPAAG